MKTIKLDSCVTTGLDPELATSTIEVEDNPVGQGGFGVAYRGERFDGRQVRPQIVKILVDNGSGTAQRGFNTVRDLQARLSNENTAMAGGLLQKFPALQAVPLLSFEGRMDGRRVLGYTSHNLVKNGFQEFGQILENEKKFRAFLTLPVSARMRIAAELVTAFELLKSRVQFIHADIKAEALFVDTSGFHCAIIDFDSGALARDANDHPSTFGTKQDWLAPEISRQLDAPGNSSRVIHVDLLSDVWSVNVAIHYLLFGLHPLFFLSEISERSMDAYLLQFKWPVVDPAFRYFRKDLTLVYRQYTAYAGRSIPRALMERLAFTVNEGFRKPARRTLYGQWAAVLGTLNHPAIRRFAADRTVVEDDRPLHLSWDVTGAERLELSGVGDVTNRTSVDVRILSDTVFDLTLTPHHGSPIVKSLNVTVDTKPPLISAFLASTQLLTGATPARLTWAVARAARLQIDHGVGDVSLQSSAGVLPRADTTYTLTATSYFGVTASAQVRIRVSTKPPTIDFFRADRALLEEGHPVTLSWKASSDAHEVSISGVGAVPRSGARQVDQRQTRVYVLRAVSYFGCSAQEEVRVDVSNDAPVILEFHANPAILGEEGQTTLSWSTTGAESVTLQPSGNPLPVSGQVEVRPGPVSRFTLRAESWYGIVAERHLSVAVIRRAKLDLSRKAHLDLSRMAKKMTPSAEANRRDRG